jgi:hypothetical protein
MIPAEDRRRTVDELGSLPGVGPKMASPCFHARMARYSHPSLLSRRVTHMRRSMGIGVDVDMNLLVGFTQVYPRLRCGLLY